MIFNQKDSRSQKQKDETAGHFGISTNKIKRLSKKYKMEMFSSRLRGRKAYVVEQKSREFFVQR